MSARVCYGEQPRVYESTGATPAVALRDMADLLETIGVDGWLAARVDCDEDGVTLTIIE